MAEETQRIDKWLWHARVVKTRSLAQKLVLSARVRVNGDKTDSPSRLVRIGDVLTINLERAVLLYRIVAIAARRGPYAHARELYQDLAPGEQAAADSALEFDSLAAGNRPDKRQRRALADLRGKILRA